MSAVIWFMLGAWLGGALGFLIAAAFEVAKAADRDDEAAHERALKIVRELDK